MFQWRCLPLPAVRCKPHTAFPVPHLRPLGHLSEILKQALAAVDLQAGTRARLETQTSVAKMRSRTWFALPRLRELYALPLSVSLLHAAIQQVPCKISFAPKP